MITADQHQGQEAADEKSLLWLALSLFLPVRPFQTRRRLQALLRAAIDYVGSGARDAEARQVLLEAELHDDVVVLSQTEATETDTWEQL